MNQARRSKGKGCIHPVTEGTNGEDYMKCETIYMERITGVPSEALVSLCP